MPEFFLRPDLANGELAQARSARDLLDWAESEAERAAPEQVYRHKEGRTTLRLPHAGRSWFLKLHRGVGWVEIIKNLLQLRLPVLGAANEYRAVAALQRVGVDTLSVAAYASRGRNPARWQSMIVTEDLVDTISLEDYCADWASEPPPARIKMQLIRKLADSARRMHAAGINHRDFYICHFHLDESSLREAAVRCHLIDLHRAQLRQRTPMRWRVKDLAGLYFSAMDCGLTQRDLLRFVHHYSPGGLRQGLRENGAMWAQVQRKALQLYGKGYAETAAVKGGSVDAR